jgi:protein-S-isoprenylcysteine O-methyltransferase Ste14
MNVVITIIVLCWGILAVVWTIGAFFQKRNREVLSLGSKIMQAIFMIVPFLLLLKNDYFWLFNLVIINQSRINDIVSEIFCIIGLIIMVWARVALGRNWSVKVVYKNKHELVTKGFYRYIRHPIYSGFLLLFLGTAIAIGRVGAFVGFVVLLIGLLIKIGEEEKLMIKHFDREYIDFKKKSWKLVPYLY